MKIRALIFAVAGALACQGAQAWGTDGHRIVGAMADQLIKGSRAEQQVAALLLPGESLELVANWADCVKGSYCGPQSDEMKAYTAVNPKHSEYHYTDVPFQETAYHAHGVGTADDDIVQTLGQAIAVLRGKADAASNPHGFTPRQALLLLTHLSGDIHQPLHVGAAYIGKDGGYAWPQRREQIDAVAMFDARGGNNLLLDDARLVSTSERLIPALPAVDGAPARPAPASKSPTRPFHSYWDSTVVDYAMRRSGARTPRQFVEAALASNPAPADAVNSGDPAGWPRQWADDALAAAKLAYADVVPGAASRQTSSKGEQYTVWALAVPDQYPVPSSALARTQLIKGGYHLAALLKAIWPQ